MNEIPTRQGRSGGRYARRALREAPDLSMMRGPKRGLPLCEPMPPAEILRIAEASMAILAEPGAVFRGEIALADRPRAGARVEGGRAAAEDALNTEY